MQEADLVAARQQRVQSRFVAVGGEQIAEEEQQPGAAGARGVAAQGEVQVGDAAAWGDFQELQQADGLGCATIGSPGLIAGASQQGDGEQVAGGEGDVAQRRRQPQGVALFVRGGVRRPGHAAAGVHKQVNGEVFFLFQQLHKRALQASVDVPVEAAQVVAGCVVAVVGEFNGGATLAAAAVPFHRADADAVGDQG